MAVVTHGSFDEGPIVLALPPVYEYAGAEETDPIFSAWDKHTGISIFRSQISDGNELIDTDDLLNLPSITSTGTITALDDVIVGDDLHVYGDVLVDGAVNIQGNITAANLTGSNTGDQDISGFVPYSGATGNVDLGTNNLYANHVYLDGTITDSTEAVSKGWVEALVGNGIELQTSVDDFVTAYANLPGGPSDGDRYITSDTGSIWEYETDEWVEHVPAAGWQVWVIAEGVTYTFDGSIWRIMVSAINHNDTLNIQGGTPGQRWHLSDSEIIVIPIVNPGTVIGIPTNLHVISKGISIVNGHQSAYVELGWDANAESAFDHYIVYYKRTGFEVWSEVICSTNEIRIEGLVPSVSYDFAVAAVNKGGNVTDMSGILVTTMYADTEPPATVTGLVATGAIQAVLLRWTHNTDMDLNIYNIYRNTVNDSGTATKIATYQGNAFMDNGPVVVGTIGLAVDTTYYYWLKAVDLSGNESLAFSTEAHATTRNIVASDIVNIAASQVIIQGVTTLASWTSPGVTTIDGDKITTGTVTLTKLNFTPTLSNQIVATLNASAEGLQINANLFKVSGTSVFAPKQSSEDPSILSRVYFYPNANTAIRITDNNGANVFLAEIGGDGVGDITIGNYASGHGIWYDKSTNKTTFRGRIEASEGSIYGVLDFGTLAIDVDGLGSLQNIALYGNHIWENMYSGDNSTLYINSRGYAGGASKYRNTVIGNGKGVALFTASGLGNSITMSTSLEMTTTTGAFTVPRMYGYEREALDRYVGRIVYDIDQRAFCGVVYDPVAGGNRWWTFSMNARLPV
jgi:hypothetical protein